MTISRIPPPPASADADTVAWMLAVAAALNSVLINYNSDGDVVIDEEVMEGGIVSMDGTQTLTNKTLTAPTINSGVLEDPTLNGTVTLESPLPVSEGGTGLDTLGTEGQLFAVDGSGGITFVDNDSEIIGDVTISGNTSALNISNYTIARATLSGGTDTLHGIAGGTDGRRILIQNITAGDSFAINNQSGTEGTATNRIITPAGIAITCGGGAILWYDGTTSRWRVAAYS